MGRTYQCIVKWRAGLIACMAGTALLAGCATGQPFTADGLAQLQPGRSTMRDAVRVLDAMPRQVLPQSDGSTVALWAYKRSLVVDAIYYRREAVLQFGPDGRLERVLDTTNVPLSDASRQKLLGVAAMPDETPAPGGATVVAPAGGAAAIPVPTP
jgi:hypothetical protein